VTHVPVLAHESIEALRIDTNADAVFVDATFGRGGHSRLILERLSPRGRLIALDRDQAAIEEGQSIRDGRLEMAHARFGRLEEELKARGVTQVAGVLIDLGVSSPQLDDPERGFSFRGDGPLDMRMDATSGETVAQWLDRADEGDIKEVIKSHGEERFAKQIAAAIVAARQGRPITRTGQLADIVGAAVRTREPGQNPATRTFQALRIHINQELEELEIALPQCLDMLNDGGRLVVISFHSLEDRIVKHFMRTQAQPGALPARLPVRAAELPKPRMQLVGKPIYPTDEEIAANPRARSAVMRVAERIAA
jgi:16S rRNA (cytosine1402-N4)-methyltransferase